ncbi:MAG: DUF6183 family protein [Archangium sp.]|nr:DUF6183 family protein [Archangium sp.]
MKVQALLARFPQDGAPDNAAWKELQQAISGAVREGDQDFLFALHEACGTHPLLRGWPRQSSWRAAGLIHHASALRRFLERAKQPPSSEQPWGRAPRLVDGPARNLGAMLAYAHDDDLLERELEHFGPEPALRDLFACWVQERVVRGSPIGRSAFVQQLWRALPASHALSTLPLEVLPLEAGLVKVSPRRDDTLGNWFEFDRPSGHGPFEPEGDWQTLTKELAAEPAVLAAVAADEGLCPNSTYEGRVFQLDRRPPSLSSLALRSLSLECLGANPAKVKPCDAREVMGLLLTLGTIGGAYGEGRSAAYGRLLAWRSLTALAGLPAGAPLAEVEALAQRLEWLSFESDSDWFNHVSLDVGLVGLRADDSLAVVAMTDTD